MSSNLPNHEVEVSIGPQGLGRATVPHAPARIECVKMRDHAYGEPRIRPAADPQQAWVEVLGAIPDTTVTVVYYCEGVRP